MKRAELYTFTVENINRRLHTDTIIQRVKEYLADTSVEELLEIKHSGDLDNRADAIIRIVAGQLYSERA